LILCFKRNTHGNTPFNALFSGYLNYLTHDMRYFTPLAPH